jgi:two-component system chemotaxis response regulator CheB
MTANRYEVVVIGSSAGGLNALKCILALFPRDFAMAVVIVQHLHPSQDDSFIEALRIHCPIPVREAEEKEAVLPGAVYFAPPNYHLMIESDRTFSLSIDPKVNFSRPSIDILFETAAEVYGPRLIGVILTGANEDGAAGLRAVKEKGGLAIVQDPSGAEFRAMPGAALEKAGADHVLSIEGIGGFLAGCGRLDA